MSYLFLPAAEPLDSNDTLAALLGDHTHNSTHITVTRGDYAPILEQVVQNLQEAKVGSATLVCVLIHTYIHVCKCACVFHGLKDSFWPSVTDSKTDL